MSIKAFVNNRAHYEAFIDYLDTKKKALEKSLVSATDLPQIYRLQGEIRQIDKLKLMKEEILANETAAG